MAETPLVPHPRTGERMRRVNVGDLVDAEYVLMSRLARAMRLEGASWGEIARETGLPSSTAHRRWAALVDEPIALMAWDDGRTGFYCPGTGLAWGHDGTDTPLQAWHRDRRMLDGLVERAALQAGVR